MVKRVVNEDGQNWDILPYVFFVVLETLQVSTGFMPFELLFSHWPKDLLDTVREAWKEQPSPLSGGPVLYRSKCGQPREQQQAYSWLAQPRKFSPVAM